jgi:hypothetical protein
MCLNEKYSKVRIGNHLSDNSPIQQRDTLPPLLLNFAVEYAIRKVQANQMGLKLHGTHQLLNNVYADYPNILGDNTDTTKATETLIDPSKGVV